MCWTAAASVKIVRRSSGGASSHEMDRLRDCARGDGALGIELPDGEAWPRRVSAAALHRRALSRGGGAHLSVLSAAAGQAPGRAVALLRARNFPLPYHV